MLHKFESEVLDQMSPEEFVRWLALGELESQERKSQERRASAKRNSRRR